MIGKRDSFRLCHGGEYLGWLHGGILRSARLAVIHHVGRVRNEREGEQEDPGSVPGEAGIGFADAVAAVCLIMLGIVWFF